MPDIGDALIERHQNPASGRSSIYQCGVRTTAKSFIANRVSALTLAAEITTERKAGLKSGNIGSIAAFQKVRLTNADLNRMADSVQSNSF
jgi:hypothetical protein